MFNPFNHLTENRAQNAGSGRHFAGLGSWLCCSGEDEAHRESCLNLRGEGRDLYLGGYPELSLKAARKAANHRRELARSGLDSVVEQKAFRNAAARKLRQFYC